MLAAENDVPGGCNELCVNDSPSGLEARVKYNADVEGVSSEAQIPRQHRLSSMGADTILVPEYMEAVGLEG